MLRGDGEKRWSGCKTIQTAKHCAEMCQTCSSFVIGESRFAADICKLCAEVCKACAVACDKISGGVSRRNALQPAAVALRRV